MSDKSIEQITGSNFDSSLANSSVTAGQMLRQARLTTGLHIAALAVSLKVPVKRIEALESDQLDLLPGMVFVRALTSSICQTLKIDAQPILERLPKAALPRLNHNDVAINKPVDAASTSHSSWVFEVLTSPLMLGVLFLCVAAACVYFWPINAAMTFAQVPTATSSSEQPGKSSIEVGINQAKEVILVQENIATPSVNTSANLGVNSANNTPVVEITGSTSAVSTATSPAASSSLTADNLITFKATGETWVEVKSAKGNTLFKKLLMPGETAGASGAVPFTVIVGRADATEVQVRGKSIDLMSIAKSNVARFEVN